jgi:hypothetical protein
MDEQNKIDLLLDAIESIKDNRRKEAQAILRELIRMDNNFEDAWLWMAVAVDSTDQTALCLDNVLRVNPNNLQAAGALYRLRAQELLIEDKRRKYQTRRNIAFGLMWVLIVVLLNLMWVSMMFFQVSGANSGA